MTGAIANGAGVVLGTYLASLITRQMPRSAVETMRTGLGLFTLTIGLGMGMRASHPLAILLALAIGGVIGSWCGITERLRRLDKRVDKGTSDNTESTVSPMLTASLLFCVGPMAILGAINDGLRGDPNLLYVKTILDFFTAAVLAASIGKRVGFAAVPLVLYEGVLTVLAHNAGPILREFVVNDLTGCGGLLIIALAIDPLLDLKRISVADFLPALALVIPLSFFCEWAKL